MAVSFGKIINKGGIDNKRAINRILKASLFSYLYPSI
jgi:hypothetical protein